MFWRNEIVAVASVVVSLGSSVNAYDFGRPATSEEINVFEQAAPEPSDEMVLVFLVELDGAAR